MEEGLPTPGTLISEFRIGKPLGMGGCGAVFHAYQERLERNVALKVLLPSAASRIDDLAKRFMREIDLVRRLEHPNIVRLYDFGQTDTGLLWMAMELVKGTELRTVLKESGGLHAERVRTIMLQVLSALAEAHSMGIVHRDLKPGNIMLTHKGADQDVVKLLDFGIGKAFGEDENAAVQDLTIEESATIGTPRYMAPELLLRDGEGPHSDVYAAGLILFETLVGRAAVEGDTTYQILARQIHTDLMLPPWIADSKLSPILRKATEKAWDRRYRTALQFHTALREVDLSDLGGSPGAVSLTQTQRNVAVRGDHSEPLGASLALTTGRVFDGVSHAVEGLSDMLDVVVVEDDGSEVIEGLGASRAAAPAAPAASAASAASAANDPIPVDHRRGQLLIAAAVVIVIVSVAWALSTGGSEESEGAEALPPPEQSDPAPVVADMVPWIFDSSPQGASVSIAGATVCQTTPCRVELLRDGRATSVALSLEGYEPGQRALVPSMAGSLHIDLHKLPVPDKAELAPDTDAHTAATDAPKDPDPAKVIADQEAPKESRSRRRHRRRRTDPEPSGGDPNPFDLRAD